MIELLLYTFIVTTIIQLLYHMVLFGRVIFQQPSKVKINHEAVSVILYTKNQADELSKTIENILNQQYHSFEIVIVNNASTDHTLDILKTYVDEYPNIKLVNVANNENFWGSAKYALTLGIKAASHELLLFTDTQQTIKSSHWLSQMSAKFSTQKTIVLGIELYRKEKGFFNKIMRYIYLNNQRWHLSFYQLGKPISLPANNVAYKKNTFFDNQGYIRFMQYFDYTHELFLSEVSNKKNTEICLNHKSFSYIESPKNTREFIRLSIEEKAIASYFGWIPNLFKSFYSINVWLFFALLIVLLINQHHIYIILSIFAFRYVFCWFINGKTQQFFGNKDLIWWFPVLEWIELFAGLQIAIKKIFTKTMIRK